jgi:choline dehydrogenase-like flavoprotein
MSRFFVNTELKGHTADWNYTITPQPGLGGRSLIYPRGKILGGSSTFSLLVWNRGTSEDYDRWATLTEDEGWSWENMLPYFIKVDFLANYTPCIFAQSFF